MMKKVLGISIAAGVLSLALPAFAATTATTAQIACVGSAVSVRESALDNGMYTLTQAMSAAYSARAAALQAAYSQTPGKGTIAAAIKAAWSAFRASMKSSRTSWQSAKNSAWSTFRTSVKACKAPAVATDTANASSEASGQ